MANDPELARRSRCLVQALVFLSGLSSPDANQLPAVDRTRITVEEALRAVLEWHRFVEENAGAMHHARRKTVVAVDAELRDLWQVADSWQDRDSIGVERSVLLRLIAALASAVYVARSSLLTRYAYETERPVPPRSARAADDEAWNSDADIRAGSSPREIDDHARGASHVGPTQKAAFEVAVYFGTSRPVQRNAGKESFLPGRGDGELKLGLAQVTLPESHRIGEFERPSRVWIFRKREDPARHIMLRSAATKSEVEWAAGARTELEHCDDRAALLFIHGYNVGFDQAMMRAAQLAHDVSFSGLVTAFSWGSAGTVLGYMADEEAVEVAHEALCSLLRTLRDDVGVKEIHVIAHSMGNRALLNALQAFPPLGEPDACPWGEVVFAAPDVDAQRFRAGIAKAAANARRYTLYGSEKDWPLVISRILRGNFARAGDGGEKLVICPSVDSIDATQVGADMLGLGHSYLVTKRPVITDLCNVLLGYAMTRAGLRKKTHPDGPYWAFKP